MPTQVPEDSWLHAVRVALVRHVLLTKRDLPSRCDPRCRPSAARMPFWGRARTNQRPTQPRTNPTKGHRQISLRRLPLTDASTPRRVPGDSRPSSTCDRTRRPSATTASCWSTWRRWCPTAWSPSSRRTRTCKRRCASGTGCASYSRLARRVAQKWPPPRRASRPVAVSRRLSPSLAVSRRLSPTPPSVPVPWLATTGSFTRPRIRIRPKAWGYLTPHTPGERVARGCSLLCRRPSLSPLPRAPSADFPRGGFPRGV